MESIYSKIMEKQHDIIDEAVGKLENIIIHRYDSLYHATEILTEVKSYFKLHFATEEIFLNSFDFDIEYINEHTQEHAKFLEFLDSLSEKEHISIDLLIELKKWSDNHIEKLDKQLFNKVSTLAI